MSDADSHNHITPEDLDFDAVAKVSSRVTLASLRARHSSATLNAEPEELPADWGERAFIGFDSHAVGLSVELNRLWVVTSFIAVYVPGHDGSASTRFPAPDEVDPAIEITTAYEMVYDIEDVDDITEADTEHFAFANATMHAWPYWRDYAHNACYRMQIPPILIGMFRIPTLKSTPSSDADPAE